MASEQTVTLTIPAELYEKLEKEAEIRGTTLIELLPDLLSAYRLGYLERHEARIQELLRSHPPTPYTEEDVPRLVKEVRKELAAERRLESRP